jgi:beta-phosphoglucomutase
MIEVLLVEMEGVLVETRALRRAALAEALSAERIAVDAAAFARADGKAPREAIRAVLALAKVERDPTTIDLLALRAERAFSLRLGQGITLVPGAAEALRAAQAGARIALVTRARRADAELVIGMAGLDGVLETIVADDDVVDAKPAPDGYLLALARLARRRPFAIERAIAVEDGVSGIRAARAAGLRSLAVGAIEPLDAMEADGFATSIAGETLESLDALSARTVERSGEA